MGGWERICGWRFGALLGGLLLLSLPAAGAAPQVWVESSWTRVGPTDPAGTAGQAGLAAARGETESFQILVRAPSGGLTNVNVTAPDLIGPQGSVIASNQFTLYREEYVPVTVSSPGAGARMPRSAPAGIPTRWSPSWTRLPVSRYAAAGMRRRRSRSRRIITNRSGWTWRRRARPSPASTRGPSR